MKQPGKLEFLFIDKENIRRRWEN